MRFSKPRTASRLRRPISASSTATFFPCMARADPRLAVVVVLPTPPLPDVIVSILLLILLLPMTPCEELLQLAQESVLFFWSFQVSTILRIAMLNGLIRENNDAEAVSY